MIINDVIPADFNDLFDSNLDRLEFDIKTTDAEFDAYHKKTSEERVAEGETPLSDSDWSR